MPAAIIIGAGIMGSASAIALQAKGFTVTLVDPMREPSGASWGNAGHIAIEQPEPLASWAAVRSVPRRLFSRGGALDVVPRDWDRWLPFTGRLLRAASRFEAGKAALDGLLAQASGAWQRFAPDIYRESGHFVVWESEATLARGRKAWQAADTGTATFRDATADELARLGALLKRKPAGAIRFLNTGQITDPTILAQELTTRFTGRRIHTSAALRLMGDRAQIVVDGETFDADAILVAAGAASADVLRDIHRVPLIAERGYHIECPVTDWPRDLGPITFEDRSMIVTPFQSSVRAVSFVEFGRRQSPPDERKWARLRAHVADLGLPMPLPGTQWMGARPTLPDYLPAIGRSRRAANLLYAFGHQHLGLTLGPITAEIVAKLATGQAADIAPFDLERFS